MTLPKSLISYCHQSMLEVSVFVSGACVMVMELVGARVLAPYVGTSLFVWTNLIGVILGSLSIGYTYGGRIADKQPSRHIYVALFLLSSACLLITAVTKEPILSAITTIFPDVRIAALSAALILFAPASIILGAISPFAVKLKLQALSTSGMTVGNLYALSTAGSIFGTFLAGFVLIPTFGTTNVLLLLAGTLLLTSLYISFATLIRLKIGLVALILFGAMTIVLQRENARARGFIDEDSQYSRLLVYSARDRTGRPVRVLSNHIRFSQSAMFLDATDDLVNEYTKYYHLVGHFYPHTRSALMLGGGAYSYPRAYLAAFPQSKIDVIEIDPMVTLIAKQYFGLTDSPRLHTYSEDGRLFLNRTTNTYDSIFIDAFNDIDVPYQLTTREAVAHMYRILMPEGIVIVNLMSALEGEHGQFFRAAYATYRAVFPLVYVFPVDDPSDGHKVQNLMMVALKSGTPPSLQSQNKQLSEFLSHRWPHPITSLPPVLTDAHAPVEYYMKSVVNMF